MANLFTTLLIVLDSVGCLWSLPRVDILHCHGVKITMTAVPLSTSCCRHRGLELEECWPIRYMACGGWSPPVSVSVSHSHLRFTSVNWRLFTARKAPDPFVKRLAGLYNWRCLATSRPLFSTCRSRGLTTYLDFWSCCSCPTISEHPLETRVLFFVLDSCTQLPLGGAFISSSGLKFYG